MAQVTQLPLFEDADLDEPAATVDELLRWLSRAGYRNADLGRARRILANTGDLDDLQQFTAGVAPHLGDTAK